MIDSKEILPGNYFNIHHNNQLQLCVIVKALEEPYFIVSILSTNERTAVNPVELEPVPLSEEWIRKFGFMPGEIIDHWTAQVDGQMAVLKHNGPNLGWTLMHNTGHPTREKCLHVHHLQNDYYTAFKKRPGNGKKHA